MKNTDSKSSMEALYEVCKPLLVCFGALLMSVMPCFSASPPDSYQFFEGHIPGSPLYHVSLHIHLRDSSLKHSYPTMPTDWYIGGLSSFRKGQIRGPIVTGSLKTDHAARVLGFSETEVGIPKPIDHDLALKLVHSAVYLKTWLPKQQFPYSGIPIHGVGLTSNSIVRAILVKNGAYYLWSDLQYPHIAPGMARDDPGLPMYDAPALQFPLIGEMLYWVIVAILITIAIRGVLCFWARQVRRSSKTNVNVLSLKEN